MLHIILFILKVIGCILLAILGLAILFIGIVLVAPFCYQVEGQCGGDLKSLAIHAKFSFFLRVIRGTVIYKEEKLDWNIWVLHKHLGENKDIPEGKVEKSKSDAAKQPLESKIESEIQPEVKTGGQPLVVEEQSPIEKTAIKEAEQKQNQNKRKFDLKRRIEKIQCTIRIFCDKIKSLLRKKEILIDFIENEVHKTAFLKLISELKKLFRKLRPEKFQLRIHFGFDDPAWTGKALAIISTVYPFVGEHAEIEPDFEEKNLDGDLFLKGHVRLLGCAVMAWNMLWSKQVRMTVRDIMKFSFE